MRRLALAATCVAVLAVANPAGAQNSDPLEQGFKNPPASARPRVWWHWMNGNITKEGIALDLDWMHRVGIAGFQNFDAALFTPQVVEKRLVYMTPDWREAFRFAIERGNSLGMEMAIAGSPGWSETGGPWVEPQHGMKKLVWSETIVDGGKRFQGTLSHPPEVTGPFQSLSQQDPMGQMGDGLHAPKIGPFYADTVVVAYQSPVNDVPIQQMQPVVTTNNGAIDTTALWDGDLMTSSPLTIAPAGKTAWIQFAFASPQTVQSMTFAFGGPIDPLAQFRAENGTGPVLEYSDDGISFQAIAKVPTVGAVQHTLAFPARTARYFRLSFLTAPELGKAGEADLSDLGMTVPPKATQYQIAELQLHGGARVNRFEEKAAFATLPDNYAYSTPDVTEQQTIRKAGVVDLTGRMKPDGSLDWTPPPGKWTVLRMGYSLTGITNHPAPPEATGPEVDKLNKADVHAYIEKYLDSYQQATGGLMGDRGVRYIITDSWEAGTQNWTDDMIAEFTRRRGYSPLPWMPVLTGHVVNSAADSDRFLWDFRRTIADLVAENHYGTIAEALHARGMGQYGESHESGRATIGDGMEMKRADTVPMGAMWTQVPGVNAEQFGYNADIRESASVAHVYGQNLVAAESLTAAVGPWAWPPAALKPTADKELAMGLNRFVIHESAHQPLVGKAPGLALGPFGQWFNRNEIWAEQAGPWMTYLARNSFLLQQGRFVADIAYFYGEDSNLTAIFGNRSPNIPDGYNFDYVNGDILNHQTAVKDGRLVTSGGMNYRLLALDPYSKHMSLSVLRRIEALVQGGATVVGQRPIDDPSLMDQPAEFRRLCDELWPSPAGPHRVGKGQVWPEEQMPQALASLQSAPDFKLMRAATGAQVLFVHRHVADKDLYFVDNRNPRMENVQASFRISGKKPELWYPDSGLIKPATYTISEGNTTVDLRLEPYGTVFVVFREPTQNLRQTVAEETEKSLTTMQGPWEVSFEAGRGAPAQERFDTLASWSASSIPGVRYFSGHGTYNNRVTVESSWIQPGSSLWLDLGDVENVAEVSVNGRSLGILWKAPYRIDISSAVHSGQNDVKIRVGNLWVNRLIGDQQPGAEKITFTTRNPYKATSPLLPSGLLGPVRILQVSEPKSTS